MLKGFKLAVVPTHSIRAPSLTHYESYTNCIKGLRFNSPMHAVDIAMQIIKDSNFSISCVYDLSFLSQHEWQFVTGSNGYNILQWLMNEGQYSFVIKLQTTGNLCGYSLQAYNDAVGDHFLVFFLKRLKSSDATKDKLLSVESILRFFLEKKSIYFVWLYADKKQYYNLFDLCLRAKLLSLAPVLIKAYRARDVLSLLKSYIDGKHLNSLRRLLSAIKESSAKDFSRLNVTIKNLSGHDVVVSAAVTLLYTRDKFNSEFVDFINSGFTDKQAVLSLDYITQRRDKAIYNPSDLTWNNFYTCLLMCNAETQRQFLNCRVLESLPEGGYSDSSIDLIIHLVSNIPTTNYRIVLYVFSKLTIFRLADNGTLCDEVKEKLTIAYRREDLRDISLLFILAFSRVKNHIAWANELLNTDSIYLIDSFYGIQLYNGLNELLSVKAEFLWHEDNKYTSFRINYNRALKIAIAKQKLTNAKLKSKLSSMKKEIRSSVLSRRSVSVVFSKNNNNATGKQSAKLSSYTSKRR